MFSSTEQLPVSLLNETFNFFWEILGQSDWITLFPFLNYWSLQSANLSDEMEGFFSTGSKMTLWMLIYLLVVFLGLVFLGILCQVYTKCYLARVHAVTEGMIVIYT